MSTKSNPLSRFPYVNGAKLAAQLSLQMAPEAPATKDVCEETLPLPFPVKVSMEKK